MVAWDRARRYIQTEAGATGLPLGALLTGAVAAHVVVLLLAVNPWHPDEHFQILEFAWARAGLAPLDVLPWEFAARVRPTLQPTLALVLLEALRAMGITSPFPWMLLLRLGTLATSFAVVLWVSSQVTPGLDRSGRRALWLAGLLLWFAPLFMFRFSSENLAGLALVAALPLAEGGSASRSSDWRIGALLGLSFAFRFQVAFAIVALLLWAAIHHPRGLRGAVHMGLAAAAVAGAGSLVDVWFYGDLVFTPWLYFQSNLLDGVASSFGTSPWYAYLLWPALWMVPPLSLVVLSLVGVGLVAHRRSAWTWAFTAFLVGHSLVAHKEGRFLLPLFYFVPVLAARGAQVVCPNGSPGGWRRAVRRGLAGLSGVLLLLLLTPAVHRQREFDAHYLRWLWDAADDQAPDTVYVLHDKGDPYLVHGLEANVYRHPRVRDVIHASGADVPPDVPGGTPPDRLLVLTRGSTPPSVAGARMELAYAAEPGYRVMARWLRLEDFRLVRWLEAVDGWTDSEETRRVYRVRVLRPDTGTAP